MFRFTSGLIIGFLLSGFLVTAKADTNIYFQSNPQNDNARWFLYYNSTSTNILPSPVGPLANTLYKTDFMGNIYWDIEPWDLYFGDGNAESDKVLQNVPIENDGWYWWILFERNTPATDLEFEYESGTSTQRDIRIIEAEPESEFLLGTTTAELQKLTGFRYSPVTNLRMNGGGAGNLWKKLYFIVYTNENLSYIDTQEEFTNYINSLPNQRLPTNISFGNTFATSTSQDQALNECSKDSSLFSYGLCWALTKTFYPSESSLAKINQLKYEMFDYFPMSLYADWRLLSDELFARNASSTATTTYSFTQIPGQTYKLDFLPLETYSQSEWFINFKNMIGMVIVILYGLLIVNWAIHLFK